MQIDWCHSVQEFYWNKPEDVLVSLIILNCTNALKMTFLRFYEMKLDKNYYSKRDLFVKETSIYIWDNFRVVFRGKANDDILWGPENFNQ